MLEELGFEPKLPESKSYGLYTVMLPHCIMLLLDILFLSLLYPPPHFTITVDEQVFSTCLPEISAAKGLCCREMGRQPLLCQVLHET